MALVTYLDEDGNEVTFDDGSDVSETDYTDAGDTNTNTETTVDWSGGSNPTTEIENTAVPGSPGYGWKYYSDGTVISPNGDYYQNGNIVWSPSNNNDTSDVLDIQP